MNRFSTSCLLASCIGVAGVHNHALAQDEVAGLVQDHRLEFDGGMQTVIITVSAWFDPGVGDLFSSTIFNLTVDTDEPVFFEPLVDQHDSRRLIVIPPSTYINIVLGQFHFPLIGAIGDESNPIPIAEFRFSTDDLRRRDLVVEVPLIFSFAVYPDAATGGAIALDPGQFPESIVWTIPIGLPCRADFDEDGQLTIFDFLAFQNAFDAGDLTADFDGDGELTIFDFLAFQNAFDAGGE